MCIVGSGRTHKGLSDGGHGRAVEGVYGDNVNVVGEMLFKGRFLWRLDGCLARDNGADLCCWGRMSVSRAGKRTTHRAHTAGPRGQCTRLPRST